MYPQNMSCLRLQLMNRWNGIILIHLVRVICDLKKFFMIFFAIKTFINVIDKYHNTFNNGTFTRNVVILGCPGGVKTWCGMYVILYIISKISSAM